MTAGFAVTSAGGPCRDDAAEVEHNDAVARAHDETHVVVDEQHSHSPVDDPAQHRAEVVALDRVEPGRRFVQQHHSGSGCEGSPHPDELALAFRELRGGLFRDVGDPEFVEKLVHHGVVAQSRREDLGGSAQERRAQRNHAQVLAHGEIVEEFAELPRARDSATGTLVRAQGVESRRTEPDRSGRFRESGDRVDAGRLARAVGADETDQLAGFYAQRDVREGDDAAVANGETRGGECVRHHTTSFAGAGRTGRVAGVGGRRVIQTQSRSSGSAVPFVTLRRVRPSMPAGWSTIVAMRRETTDEHLVVRRDTDSVEQEEPEQASDHRHARDHRAARGGDPADIGERQNSERFTDSEAW